MRALILLLLLAGCESLDRPYVTQFVPTDNGFKYKARVGDLESPEAEDRAMRMLREWLDINNKCKNGFRITSKQPVVATSFLGQKSYDVWYEGRCA